MITRAYCHFNANPAAGFDEEFFLQLLSERKEKRKRVGVITTRWVQTRERNEALDLMCMILCILEMYRGTLDAMDPVIATGEKDPAGAQPGVKWGARKMIVTDPIIWRHSRVRRSTIARSKASGARVRSSAWKWLKLLRIAGRLSI
jgi:Terminase large subunit gpA, endonuclease domain